MLQHTSPSHDSDSTLIVHLRETGAVKRLAEDQLFRKYLYFIGEATRKYSLSNDDASDAYSDATLSVIDTISNGTFRNRSSLKTYLYAIFNNKCVDLVRKNSSNKRSVHRTVQAEEMFRQLKDTAKSVLQVMIDKNDGQHILGMVEKLGEACKKILISFANDYSDNDIAMAMNYKSADVVKTTRLRCLEKLRKLCKR